MDYRDAYTHPITGEVQELGFLDALSAGVSFLTGAAKTVSPLAALFGKKKKADDLKKALPFLLAAQMNANPVSVSPAPPPPVQMVPAPDVNQRGGMDSMMPMLAIGAVALILMMKK